VTVTISKVSDLADVEEWQRVEELSVPVDHPGLLADPVEEAISLFRGDGRADRAVMFIVRDGSEVVGNEMVSFPLLDNLESAMVHVTVAPDHRRRGIGRTLATHLFDVARAEGRSRAMGFVASPMDTEGPGLALVTSLGAKRVNENLRRELDLRGQVDRALAALVGDRVGSRADGYHVVTWVDRAPDELVDGAARLMGRMSTDAPQGDSTWEPEAWDAARYRDSEAVVASRRRRRFVAGAVDDTTGELVAYTDIGVSMIRPTVAYQWDTVVDPDHRGHRLGLAIKVENLRQLRGASPESERMETWNAASNSFMIAVNDALGFRPVERTTHWELGL
jgi:GNAT superfamily N-acetyltransferase